MSHKNRWIAVIVVTLLASAGSGFADEDRSEVRLQVAPDGRLSSIEAARDRIRQQRESGQWIGRPITVTIAPGRYELDRPLTFEPQDSGSADAPVVYAAAEGGRPVCSGGRRITDWQEREVNAKPAWVAELPEVREGHWYFQQLFVNGERRMRPRVPKEGSHRFAGYPGFDPKSKYTPGQSEAFFEPGEIQEWRNITDVELVILHYWVSPRMQIAAVDDDKHLVTFTQPTLRRLTDSFRTDRFARFYADNVFEALDEPGKWYLDRTAGRLYYMPKPGETTNATTIIAPRVEQLLVIQGASGDQSVHDLTFRGLSFEHAERIDPKANPADRQASNELGGAVRLAHAKRCELKTCEVRHVSGYAVEIDTGCEEARLDDCVLDDMGAGGVKLWHNSTRSTLTNNVIANGGHIFHNSVGVLIGKSSHNLVAHNDIHHFYYTGVSVGWSWGYQPSSASHNIIEHNHIHHIGQGLLSDMAGVYTLGVSPGTCVRYNCVHDVQSDNYGGWGLYCDEGSTGIVMENNLVYRTTDGGFHQHYGRDNIIRNNIFAFGHHAQIMRTRQEEHNSFTFERNIIYFDQPKLLGSNWGNDRFTMDHNLYWRLGGEPFDFAGASLEQWRGRGHDVHSLIADPLFSDPDKGNFTLCPDSPASRVGFEPFDASRAGPLR